MKECIGDIWEAQADYRIITTNGMIKSNGELVMGAGLAKQAAMRFPKVPAKLGFLVNWFGNQPFIFHDEKLITWPTKQDWRGLSQLDFVLKNGALVVAIVGKFAIANVAMTRVGCGLGGLGWCDIQPELAQILDDRFTVYSPSE